MLISHETPISLLPESLCYNAYDYALVHLLPTHSEYRNFYFESVRKGRHVLLDNSLFELGESYDPEQFAYWVNELKPTEYIIPDVFNNKDGTITSYENFISKYDNLPGKKIAVVHGKTYEEFVECYEFFINTYEIDKIAFNFVDDYFVKSYEDEIRTGNLKIPPLWLDIPDNEWKKYALGRAMLIERLAREKILRPYMKHHLLGATLPREFSLYFHNKINSFITSIDTSNPIVAGLLGHRYDEDYGLKVKWHTKLVDLIDATPNQQQLKDIFYNIFTFKNYIEKTNK